MIDFPTAIGPVARELLGEPNQRLSSKDKLRFGTCGSLSIDLIKATYYDHETDVGGGLIDLVQREIKADRPAALQWLQEHGFDDSRTSHTNGHAVRQQVAAYDYPDENANLAYQVIRYSPKDFRQRRPDGAGGWIWKLDGIRPLPYRLPELIEDIAADRLITIVEGEKDVDRLRSIGVPATCNSGGANKWRPELNEHFRGAEVVIVPDNDDPGRAHADQVGASLSGTAARVRLLDLPGLSHKQDASDWIAAGGTFEQLNDLFDKNARLWKPGEDQKQAPLLTATPFKWMAPAEIPTRKWLWGRHAIRQFLSATIAPSGAGKTSNAIAEQIAFVVNRDLLKDHLITSGRAWYIGLEDPLEEYQRRVAAIALHHRIQPIELNGGFFLDSGRNQDFVIAREGRNGIVIADPIVNSIVDNIIANEIAHVTIDPFVSCHAVRENDNIAIDSVARAWADIADRTNAAIELVHHIRKIAPGQELTADDARGGSALVGKARSVRLLSGMTKEEAEQAGVDDRRRFFRLVNGKANLALPSEKAIWRQLVSVSLGNGNGGPDDLVQAAATWLWPDAFAGLTSTDLRRVQERIAAGEYRASPQASDWAGYAVAEVLHIESSTKAGRHKIKRLIDEWVKNGALRIEMRTDPKNRHARPFVVIGACA